MNSLVTEWVEKADGDFRTATRELRVRTDPTYDAVCFHAQQCAEKYLKAYLQANGRPNLPIHHLVRLLEKCREVDLTFEMIRAELEALNDYAVDIRYPGDRATYDEAREAARAMKTVRLFVRHRLGLVTVRKK